MRCASIDIGTNTALLLIADVDNVFTEVDDISSMTRLGEGLLKNGYLLDAAMDRALNVLKRYAEEVRRRNVERIYCVGTAALREAKNSAEFLEKVHTQCGIAVDVISGAEEAYFTYLSVCGDVFSEGRTLYIVDIGGGSTEIIVGDRERFTGCVSLPVGTVRLTEMFIQNDPPSETEIDAMRKHIRSLMGTTFDSHDCILVGTGGTVTNLAVLQQGLSVFDKAKIHGSMLCLDDLRTMVVRLNTTDVQGRMRMRGMEKGREDIIGQGAALLEEIMMYNNFSHCVVSAKGVRYGVLAHYQKLFLPG